MAPSDDTRIGVWNVLASGEAGGIFDRQVKKLPQVSLQNLFVTVADTCP